MSYRFIGADTETTGLDFHNGDRVVEVGLVEYIDRKPTGRTFHRYLNPDRPVDVEARRVHGLTDEFLRSQPRFAEIADDLQAFVDGAELVIHNAEFDLTFLNGELARCGRPPLTCSGVIDSLEYVRLLEPGKRASLDAMADRYGVDRTRRTLHGALLDAQLLCEIYIQMTRRQSDLLLLSDSDQDASLADPTQFSELRLLVIEPSDDEIMAHEAYLADLARESKGRCIWLANESADAKAARPR